MKRRFLNPFQPPDTLPRNKASLRGLKWIGPYFRRQLQNAGIDSWRDLEHLLEAQNKTENQEFLRTVLRNRRATQCIDSDRGWRDFGINRLYKVRPVNWFAYNSILYYARHRFSALAVAHLPKLLKRQRANVAFAGSCPMHHHH